MSDRLKGRNRPRADTLVVGGGKGVREEGGDVGGVSRRAGEAHRKQATSGKKM